MYGVFQVGGWRGGFVGMGGGAGGVGAWGGGCFQEGGLGWAGAWPGARSRCGRALQQAARDSAAAASQSPHPPPRQVSAKPSTASGAVTAFYLRSSDDYNTANHGDFDEIDFEVGCWLVCDLALTVFDRWRRRERAAPPRPAAACSTPLRGPCLHPPPPTPHHPHPPPQFLNGNPSVPGGMWLNSFRRGMSGEGAAARSGRAVGLPAGGCKEEQRQRGSTRSGPALNISLARALPDTLPPHQAASGWSSPRSTAPASASRPRRTRAPRSWPTPSTGSPTTWRGPPPARRCCGGCGART
jgi:hypothetical protein